MKVAIQGHPTRGKEVIQILKSLGGTDPYNHLGNNIDCYYEIHGNTILCACTKSVKYKYYTLEEFEEEFPFKIGDRIVSLTTGLIGTIIKFSENGIYHFKYDNGISSFASISHLKLYKEMKKERNITLTLDKAKEWYKKGGELKEVALQAYSEKELKPLPRSWEEFYKQSNPIASWKYNVAIKYEALSKLEQLRNCWWNCWKPEWSSYEKYVIKWEGDNLTVFTASRIHAFLVFPTREIAEEFLKCFRDLIEKAGDLI